jgi:multidrug efflux pump
VAADRRRLTARECYAVSDTLTRVSNGGRATRGAGLQGAILIVEFAKQQHEREGKSFVEAAIEAARLRFRPILMTTFSFILGMIPLVVATGAGARSRVSLGTAVFGGMLIYTILGVFFIPLLYVVVEQGYAKLFGRKKAAEGALAAPVEG